MPYSKGEIPQNTKGLPKHLSSIYRSAFNSAFKKYGEESAHKIAWTAVKRSYHKNESGKWVRNADALPIKQIIEDTMKAFDRKRTRKQTRDPRGRLLSTSESEEEDDLYDTRTVQLGGITDAAPTRFRLYDSLTFTDIQADKEAKVDFTDSGYMKAMPRVARSGVQFYKGSECGRSDMETVRVYRPEREVFRKDALKSFGGIPLTLDHPSNPVVADNWKQHSVGEVGDDVLRDGEAIRVPLMLRDSAAIQAFKDGKNQLSVGYDCDLDWESGKTPDGQVYDAVQRNIKANHLAIVDAARGGPSLRIGDHSGEPTMKTLTIDGVPCEMSDVAAPFVQRTIQNLTDQVENFKKKLKEKDETEDKWEEDSLKKDEQIKVKDAEVAVLKQQLKDASDPKKFWDAVNELAGTVDKARALMGDGWKVDPAKSSLDIRREVVIAKSGIEDAKKWNDEQIATAFSLMTARNHSGGTTVYDTGSIDHARSVFAGRPGQGYNAMTLDQARQAREKAYQDAQLADENAWRGPQRQQQQQ